MSRTQSLVLVALIGIVAAASGMFLAHRVMQGDGNPQMNLAKATLLDPPRPLPELAFTDHTGAPFDASRLKNHWSLLFFGFTRCPDICPITLQTLAQVEKSLADLPEAQRPQVILVSVDPQRDTPEHLAPYVRFFSSSFAGVTGTQESIDEFTRALGVPTAFRKRDNGDYTVDHSAAIFVIDPQGSWRALFSTPHVPATIADDYRRIVNLQPS